MPSLPVRIVRGTRDPVAVERLLRALSDWFGNEESVVEYVGELWAENPCLILVKTLA